jgi:hypothetical protein
VLLPQPFEPRNPKISPFGDAEADVVDGGEVAEPLGQTFGFDGNLVRRRLRARRDYHVHVTLALLFRQ